VSSSGTEPTGDIEAEFRRQVAALERPLDLVYLRDLPLPDLISRIEAIPERSVLCQAVDMGSGDATERRRGAQSQRGDGLMLRCRAATLNSPSSLRASSQLRASSTWSS
jgi:hypothetical protein